MTPAGKIDRHPSQERQYEVITKVKSYCATETDVQGGKKSWQKISVVSLERICKWEEEERREAQLVSTLDRCGCRIVIPALETAGGVNTVSVSVIPPHKSQSCVCASSSPTVTTSRYHVEAGSLSPQDDLSNIPESKRAEAKCLRCKCKQAHTASRHIFPFFPTWLVIGCPDAPCHPSLPSIPEGYMPRARQRDWCEVGAGPGDSD
ncbi:hypothetical protein Q8A73_011080 [Channa argus]|nr:hypothetical protein Q8A73_011080 [Channa argus]